MPQHRDPIIIEVDDNLRDDPNNLLITPKARQPTRQAGGIQAVQFIDVVSVCNYDHATGYIDIGFMVGTHITWSRTFALGAAGHWLRNHVHYTLTSDYQIVCRFHIVTEGDGNYVGDHVHMNVNGYYLEPYTSP